MKTINFKTRTLLLLIVTLFTACTKENIEQSIPINKDLSSGGIMVLGKKLENPFSVENMLIAYKNVAQDGGNAARQEPITVTHYYVRYLPENDEEYEKLLKAENLELFDYPLDYEIEEGEGVYHDPTIPEEMTTWQYCVVDKDHHFFPMKYEVLSELYIPELLEMDEGRSFEISPESEAFSIKLLKEAFRLTNNEFPEEEVNTSSRGISKWTPKGYIKVYDDVIGGYIPVEGVKVRARWWFIMRRDYTDSKGYFQTGRFRYKVRYSIKWETTEYDIRNGSSFQAYYFGPTRKGDWNHNIRSGSTLRFATIHRAAHRYHYQNIGGLKRPNVFRRLKINYKDKSGSGINWGNSWQMFVSGPVLPNIKIWGKNNKGAYSSTDVIFSTTIHELAHASHINVRKWGFPKVTPRIRESWANAVEWYISKIDYNSLGVSLYDDPNSCQSNSCDNMQGWNFPSVYYNSDYTPLFIDLVDTYNQSRKRGPFPANRCPNGGTFDGTDCYIGTPPNGTAFVWGDNFYYSGSNCVSPAWYDGANCFYMPIPNGSIGWIWSNRWYLKPAGNPLLPYDEVSGYSMPQLESMLPYFNGQSSTYNKLKQHKPSYMTDKHLEVLFTYYFAH